MSLNFFTESSHNLCLKCQILLPSVWAQLQENPPVGMWDHNRSRSACAYVQADLHLHWLFNSHKSYQETSDKLNTCILEWKYTDWQRKIHLHLWQKVRNSKAAVLICGFFSSIYQHDIFQYLHVLQFPSLWPHSSVAQSIKVTINLFSFLLFVPTDSFGVG